MLHALHHHSSGFFIIMSPAEVLLVCLFVCLFVTSISTHLDAFTEQYLDLNSGFFVEQKQVCLPAYLRLQHDF